MRTAATALSGETKRRLGLTCLFGTFVFLQFTVLGLANHAGEGYLSAEQRDLVYYALQVFVILGYLLHSLYFRFCAGRPVRRAVAYGVFAAFFACVVAMLAVGHDSLGYVVASMAAVLCVGGIGGAAHLRMSVATTSGDSVALCMGLGSAVAVVMQFLLQIQWGATPLLPVFMLAAVVLLLFVLLRIAPNAGAVGGGVAARVAPKVGASEDGVTVHTASNAGAAESRASVRTQPTPNAGAAESRASVRTQPTPNAGAAESRASVRTQPISKVDVAEGRASTYVQPTPIGMNAKAGAPGSGGSEAPEPTSPKRIAAAALIAATFILFTCFYNEHIHHLMIQSDYASYTVYSWPRLMLVPGYLLFAAIGDRKDGRYVPLVSLCIMLIALLNVVLVGEQGTYWLNMCLFYFAIAAFTSYYLLTFWRLAPGTGHPAFWAPFGRMLDSGMVLLTGAIGLSTLPAAVVLGADVAGVALVILLMALGGDFNLTDAPHASESDPLSGSVPSSESAPSPESDPSPESTPSLGPIPSPESTPPPGSAPSLEPTPPPGSAPSLEERVSRLARECGLTDRECEVLAALVLTEKKNQQIADDLHISRRQLQTHISHVYKKTGAETRAGLVMRLNDYPQPPSQAR